MKNQPITIERIRRVYRGKEPYLFLNCDRTELAVLFDIAEKKTEKYFESATASYNSFRENSGDLLEWEGVEETLRVLTQTTVIKGNIVYDKLSSGRLVRRYT